MFILDSFRSITFVTLTAVVLALLPGQASALTQRDWMVTVVDSLGLSFGLPDEPKPEDYLNILQGKRNLRFEAEEVKSGADEVSTLAFLNYGSFSGSGWLLGSSRPTDVHLRFVLPRDGRYRLALAVLRAGHAVGIAGRNFTVDGDNRGFSRIEAGEIDLTAGSQEIVVTLPPGGAIDYIELTAPNLPAIAPIGGWQPEAPLTWECVAMTMVQALGLQKELPPSEGSLALEAETLLETGGARIVEDAHLGQPSAGRWLRTAARPATVIVPLKPELGGFYDLELVAMGVPVTLLVNGQYPLSVAGKPYLSPLQFPPVLLQKGENRLEVTLPPGGGLDRIMARGRQSDLASLAAAAGLTLTGDAPTASDLDHLSSRLLSAAH